MKRRPLTKPQQHLLATRAADRISKMLIERGTLQSRRQLIANQARLLHIPKSIIMQKLREIGQ